jgi:hypothetical protein
VRLPATVRSEGPTGQHGLFPETQSSRTEPSGSPQPSSRPAIESTPVHGLTGEAPHPAAHGTSQHSGSGLEQPHDQPHPLSTHPRDGEPPVPPDQLPRDDANREQRLAEAGQATPIRLDEHSVSHPPAGPSPEGSGGPVPRRKRTGDDLGGNAHEPFDRQSDAPGGTSDRDNVQRQRPQTRSDGAHASHDDDGDAHPTASAARPKGKEKEPERPIASDESTHAKIEVAAKGAGAEVKSESDIGPEIHATAHAGARPEKPLEHVSDVPAAQAEALKQFSGTVSALSDEVRNLGERPGLTDDPMLGAAFDKVEAGANKLLSLGVDPSKVSKEVAAGFGHGSGTSSPARVSLVDQHASVDRASWDDTFHEVRNEWQDSLITERVAGEDWARAAQGPGEGSGGSGTRLAAAENYAQQLVRKAVAKADLRALGVDVDEARALAAQSEAARKNEMRLLGGLYRPARAGGPSGSGRASGSGSATGQSNTTPAQERTPPLDGLSFGGDRYQFDYQDVTYDRIFSRNGNLIGVSFPTLPTDRSTVRDWAGKRDRTSDRMVYYVNAQTTRQAGSASETTSYSIDDSYDAPWDRRPVYVHAHGTNEFFHISVRVTDRSGRSVSQRMKVDGQTFAKILLNNRHYVEAASNTSRDYGLLMSCISGHPQGSAASDMAAYLHSQGWNQSWFAPTGLSFRLLNIPGSPNASGIGWGPAWDITGTYEVARYVRLDPPAQQSSTTHGTAYGTYSSNQTGAPASYESASTSSNYTYAPATGEGYPPADDYPSTGYMDIGESHMGAWGAGADIEFEAGVESEIQTQAHIGEFSEMADSWRHGYH